MNNSIRNQFHAFLDTMRSVDEIYLSQERHITSEDDIAEGYRNMLHILKRGIDLFMETDPEKPVFKRLQRTDCKTQGDCPDTIYYHTRVNSNAEFLIKGQRTTEAYLSFTLYQSEDRVWSSGVSSEINHHDMEFDEDGNYEIWVSPQKKPGNWLQSDGLSDQLMVRQYFEHSTPAGGNLELEQYRPRILNDSETSSSQQFNAEHIGRSLDQISKYMEQMTYGKVDISSPDKPSWFSTIPNIIGKPAIWQPSGSGGNGAPDVAYAAGFFSLKPGETLKIFGKMPSCDYASVLLTNRYLQSLNYCESQIILNRSNMEIAEDGSFDIYVSDERPEDGNWLDTEGRASGIVYFRFMTPSEGFVFENFQCNVI